MHNIVHAKISSPHVDGSAYRQAPVVRKPVERILKVGQSLFHEGDRAHFIYEVLSGTLRLTRVQEDGSRQVIAFGYAGDIIGFPSGGRHHTDCDVIADGSAVLHRSEVLESQKADPVLHKRLLSAALNEIGSMQDHIQMLGRKSARGKVAAFLAALSERCGTPYCGYSRVSIPMPRGDIADYLGVTKETVSRAFTQFRTEHLIALEDTHTMIVIDFEGLQQTAIGE